MDVEWQQKSATVIWTTLLTTVLYFAEILFDVFDNVFEHTIQMDARN